MFSGRRYQPVSQHVESESDSDEATIFTAENGGSARQKGEHFGVRTYDLNQDLDLPQVRPSHHLSKRSKNNLQGYTRKQALFGVCVFVVIVTTITTLAVLILLKESYSTTSLPAEFPTSSGTGFPASSQTELPTDEATPVNEECSKAPKPLVNFASSDVGSPPPPPPGCGKGKVTTEQQNIALVTKTPPSHEGDTDTDVQMTLTTHTMQKITTLPEANKDSPTTVPFNEGEIVKSTTPQSTEELLTTTTPDIPSHATSTTSDIPSRVTRTTSDIPSHVTSTTSDILSHVTSTTSQHDEQLLKNWSEKIASEITQPSAPTQTTTQQSTRSKSTEYTQTPPTTTLIPPTTTSTPPTTTEHEMTSSPSDVTSEDKVSVVPTKMPQNIDWEQDFFPAMSEATMELFDMNSDGIMDAVTVEDISQCAAKIVAMDGQNGTKFWQKEVNFPAFGVRCELDVNSDGVKDCLVIGRGAGFAAINGQDGSLLWDVDPSITFPPYNFYFPLIVEDLNNDGVKDIINMHGGDTSYKPEEHNRSPGYLVVVSGKTGQSLVPPMLTPDGHESYMSPVLFKLNGKDDLILFGTGGETVPGSLWAVSLISIRNQVKINHAYKPFINDTHHPCFMKGTDFNKIRPTFDNKAFDFERPIFVTSSASSMRFCPRWESVSPIWNKYGVCLYELYESELKGVMVPPVIVDLNQDGIDDLVVSMFDGHTVALDGSDAATKLWDAYYPNTESYSVPAPLYYNQDSIPDLLIRSNVGEWNEYNVSILRLLDGKNGEELWSFDSVHTGMMSSLSIASRSPGSDAMLFMTIGKLNSNSDQSDTDSRKWQRVRRHEHNPMGVDVGNLGPEGVEGEAEEDPSNHQGPGAVDYDDNFLHLAMSSHDPPDLWISTPDDQFPDPKVDVDGFVTYCGESFPRLTAYLWLITREMVEKGEELKPIAVHEPFLFTLPEAAPEDLPPDGSDGPPPEAMGAPPVSKRHGDTADPAQVILTKKMMRCSHISAPLQVIASPAVGDFNSDGRLDVVYSVVWSGVVLENMGSVPELKVFAFTLEERYRQVMGVGEGDEEGKNQKVVNFESFLPANQQPWNRYMGHHGNNVYHRGG